MNEHRGIDAGKGWCILNHMKAKQTKVKKKPMTLDDFAIAIQKDYTALRKDMAAGFAQVRAEMGTKAELRLLRSEMQIGFKNVNDDVKMITDTMVSKADLSNTLAEELAKSPYTRQIADLQTRVDVLESKLGIKPTRRAA
jgi:hypothetical protein